MAEDLDFGVDAWQDTCRAILSREKVGLDDMTELEKVNDRSIADNLHIRLMNQQIYTCIGRVLIAVNPFMKLDIYNKDYVLAYHNFLGGKRAKKNDKNKLKSSDVLKCSTAQFPNMMNQSNGDDNQDSGVDLPPHIYSLTDHMYRNMMMERESQCVIISGESGAGKTVSAKYIMSYLSEIAGAGNEKIEEIKHVIIQSNPLLEAFGNAKTLRNNNSSRFGKFVEILFNMSGQPDGGKISSFLLEKSRVVSQNPGERNYHVFYQLLKGCEDDKKEILGLQIPDPSQFYYLNRTGGVYTVPDTNDTEDFVATKNAMNVVGMSVEKQQNVLEIISAILHLGNIRFVEDNNVSDVENPEGLDTPAQLLGVDKDALKEKLVSRLMEARWGGKVDIMMMTLNKEQANVSRDALAKALYAQLFDYLVTVINTAMRKEKIGLCIGVLDIYGFEIFETNGFEQFCINYVNEKLQQIFVELTLKTEQEEYAEEGIEWIPVKFFNNKLVCDLIESKNPPGIMSILDDVCFTVHASEGSDRTLMEKLKAVVGSENTYTKYFRGLATHFEIHHYAGKVNYEATHFCERNKDLLFDDIIQLMQSSENEFIKILFGDMTVSSGKRGRGSTGSSKIKSQCQAMIDRIMSCTPHYVRCLKPCETKQPLDWNDQRIMPQISYLGLRENIEVRRAGFAFRRVFDKLIERYAVILPKEVAQAGIGTKLAFVELLWRKLNFRLRNGELEKQKFS
ncbi:unconventional myosin-Ie-like [Xenia sp. Carnegie-2017]|uniref:unconventional myosin-Ie-like n=1 Tax=Xenia sp. Carnegie-2017 TaxID=2897299 RepID=UPI001F04CBAF|nr:unconventional myosin-Ie-like [Xenia sp. Carnegie-2017]